VAILVLSADGTWKQLATTTDDGVETIVVTNLPPTTYFNFQQPNGEWAKLGAVESAGVLTLCVA
jgi:hypothetical protein